MVTSVSARKMVLPSTHTLIHLNMRIKNLVGGFFVPWQVIDSLGLNGKISRVTSRGALRSRDILAADLQPSGQMDATPSHSGLIRFGTFEVDLKSGEVRKAGMRQRLAGHPFQVLQALLEHPQEVVTREELRQRLWPNNTYVDFDLGLRKAVNRLRAVLGDSAENPRLIETLARRGYRFIAPIEQVSREAVNTINSLAVLPFENLSLDPEQEYFADGTTDELITQLAKIRALRVISRTSVQPFKRVRKPLPEIAHRLNVDAVVEGTVMRSGNRIRITAQLISARRDEHLWAKSYERDLGDVLKLQAEVAQDIANQVHVALNAEERSRLWSTKRLDPAAYECYLKGRYFWNRRSEDYLRKAKEYFEQAIEKEPCYALAYSGLADSYFYRGYWFGRMAPREAMPKAKAAALRALELDSALAESHVSLALVSLFFEWDWPAAKRELQRALELNPNYATAHHAYSILLAITGCKPEAIIEAERALAIDPLSIPINNIVGEMYMFVGQWDLAIEQFRKTIEMDANVPLPHENLALTFEEVGNQSEAVEEHLKARALSGEMPSALEELREAYRRSGLRGYWGKQVEFDRARWNGWHVDTFQIATYYARLGELDEALVWLERAHEVRSGGMVWIKMHPYFKNLFSDARFQDVVRRVGLPS
jgi:TolB-like protein/Tfp pilus assembly protein PilF